MHLPSPKILSATVLAAMLLFFGTKLTPEPEAPVHVAQGALARAVAARDTDQIAFCFAQKADPNEPDALGRTPLLIASVQEDWPLVRRLFESGARADLTDAAGMTPLMMAAARGEVELMRLLAARSPNADAVDRTGQTALHHALASRQTDAATFLLPLMTRFEFPPNQDRDLLNLAFVNEDPAIVQALLERLPATPEWTPQTRRALHHALKAGRKEQVKLLLAKHRSPPTVEGDNLPLLAQAIADNDVALVRTLVQCGADPNTVLPAPCNAKFVAGLSSKLIRNYLEEDSGVTVLMLAAALGKPDSVRALLEGGADRNRSTARDKWIALYFAARAKNWQALQTLLGGGPTPDQLRVEVSLGSQHAALIKNGVPIFTTEISSGRAGYGTPMGEFVVTDKDRDHRSTIYKVPMPYFMRLSCLDFGMHEGAVPRYPASHGCIRLPSMAARKLFSEIPVGTVVTIN